MTQQPSDAMLHRNLNVVRLHAGGLFSDAPLSSTAPKVAIIGCGRWGRNLIRNFSSLDALAALIDASADTLQGAQADIPETLETPCFESLQTFLNSAVSASVSGIIIATPTHTHFTLARQALEAGKHVYVEKPLATSEADVLHLETLAKSVGKHLMVGHLLLFHPAVRRLRQLIDSGELGTIESIESVRLNTNPFRPDASVLWDLAPHDLSMMAYVLSGEPTTLKSVCGERTQQDGKIDIARLESMIDSPQHGIINSRLHVSWVHPEKQVKLTIKGSQKIAILDDTRPDSKLMIQNPDSNSTDSSRIAIPYLDLEPLRLECQHFLNAISNHQQPMTHARHALPLVRLLEQAHLKLL